ncbi:MAG: hypothetical protein AB7N90_03050, partial [Vicinamibacterales bacterium]
MEDLDLDLTKQNDGAFRELDRAEDEARRRRHGMLAGEHLYVAIAEVEWEDFSRVLHELAS